MPPIGLATRFYRTLTSAQRIQQCQDIKAKIDQLGGNAVRIGSNATGFGGTDYPYNDDVIQWFLDNSTFTVVIDRHHTIGITSLNSTQLATIDTNLVTLANTYSAYGDRVILEPVNEYGGTDFYSVMQGILNRARGNGITNWLVFNRMGFSDSNPAYTQYPWQHLNDTLNRTIQGGHRYMNNATPANAVSFGQQCAQAMITGKTNTGQPIVCTENGADWHEPSTGSFTQAKVTALNTFMQSCADADIGAFAWMLDDLADMPYYESFNPPLTFPTIGPLPISISVTPISKSLSVGQSQTFTATVSNPNGAYTVQWFDTTTPTIVKGTGTTFTFTATAVGNFTYYAKATDTQTTAQSNNVAITVTSTPPPPPPPPPIAILALIAATIVPVAMYYMFFRP